MKNTIQIIIVVFLSIKSFAQNNKEIAFQKALEAIELMDNGKINESILLLEESQKLDPENFNYPYEIAYASYLIQNYSKTVEILEKLHNHKDTSPQFYALLGATYDMLKNPQKAIETYDKGIAKFPDSGHLHHEKGIVYESKQEYNKAVENYQKGIAVDPIFPSNYYRIANLYLNSDNIVPGLIYGEIFMNLERSSKRTIEMSKNLYEAYKTSIVFENGEWKAINLCTRVVLDTDEFEKNQKLPLCMNFAKWCIYGLLNSNIDEFNLDTFSKVRHEFLNSYFEEDYKSYPNFLFDYHKLMTTNKIFDAYNHYIFQMGSKSEFSQWLKENESEYDKFVDWYIEDTNKLLPTKDNYWNFTN
jgi:tetratricopeptide (TPR) repeat protein